MWRISQQELFHLAVEKYSDTVYRAAVHHCSSTSDAEDVVQDVFEKLLRYSGSFSSEEHLKAWLLRGDHQPLPRSDPAASQKDVPLDETMPAPAAADGSVLDAVRALPEHYRNAVYLHYYEGYTAAEIGRLVEQPTNTGAQLAAPGAGPSTYHAGGGYRDEMV